MGAVDPDHNNVATWARARETWGIDFQADWATVVHRRHGRSRIVFQGDPGQHETAWNQLTADITAAQTSANALVAVAMPAANSVLRRLSTPLRSAAKSRRVLPSMLDLELPFPLESCTWTFPQIAPTPERRTTALAIAARDTDIANHLETLRNARIDPSLLDHQALALWQPPTSPEAHSLRLHFGRHQTTLVLGRTHCLTAHGFRIPLTDTSVDDLAARIIRILRAHHVEGPIQAHASGPNATSTLRNIFTPPFPDNGTSSDTPAPALTALQQALPKADWTLADDAAAYLAARLAERASKSHPLPCNLIRHPTVARRLQRWRRNLALGLAATGILLGALAFGLDAQLRQREHQARQQINAFARQLVGHDNVAPGAEITLVRNHLSALEAEGQPLAHLFHQRPSAELAHALNAFQEQQIALNELRWEQNTLRFAGHCDSHAKLRALRTWFRNWGYTVDITEGPRDDNGQVAFRGEARRS